MRGYAAANSDAWYILSAEYGLLDPHRVVEPYERTLNKMSRRDRLEWAKRVEAQLLAVLPPAAEIMILAGLRYREAIVPFLEQHGHPVTVPLEGLPLGRQLQRLRQLLAESS